MTLGSECLAAPSGARTTPGWPLVLQLIDGPGGITEPATRLDRRRVCASLFGRSVDPSRNAAGHPHIGSDEKGTGSSR
jgi:hypothetical protein